MTATRNTDVGDGSMQKRLDAGRCPRCDSVLNIHMADGMLRCGICKLQVVDGVSLAGTVKDKETDMYETHLMPDVKDICDSDQKMEWSEAVNIVEQVIEQWLMDPEPVDEAKETEVRSAWQRILAG